MIIRSWPCLCACHGHACPLKDTLLQWLTTRMVLVRARNSTQMLTGAWGQGIDKEKLQEEVRQALYAAKICSYAQGMNIIKAKSEAMGWGVNMGGLARIWKVGGSGCLSAHGPHQ